MKFIRAALLLIVIGGAVFGQCGAGGKLVLNPLNSPPTWDCTGLGGSGTGNVTTAVTLTADAPVIGAGTTAIAIGTKTGTGTTFVTNTSPTLVTPVLGVATATSINKLTLTAPATGATLTLADNSSLITVGAFAATITATATTNSTLPAGTHSLAPLDSPSFTTPTLGVATATSINGLTITSTTSGTLTLANSSSLITSGGNSITLTSTGATNVTLPTTGTLVNTAVTSLTGLGTVSTSLTGVVKASSGVLSAVSGSAPDCVLVDGTSAACGSGGVGSAGNGLTLTSTTFSINTTITADLPSAQAFAGVKTFSVGPVITEGTASATLNKVTVSSTSHALNIGDGSNPRQMYATTGTPCVAAELIGGSATSMLTTCYTTTGSGTQAVLANTPSIHNPVIDSLVNLTVYDGPVIGAAYLAATPLPAAGTSVSLTGPREYYVCSGTCTVTPPVPAAGYEFCVRNGNNVTTVITMAAIGSSARYENTAKTAYGTAGTGTFVSGGAAGDQVCIVGLDSTHYLTMSFNGTWVAN